MNLRPWFEWIDTFPSSIAMRESARRGGVSVALPLADRSLQYFPRKARWHYKKEVNGVEWYREAMRQIVE